MVRENYEKILKEIREAAINAGRNPEDVVLLPVTKTIDDEIVRAAIEDGMCRAGENKPQELSRKYDEISSSIDWHLIGSLQTNKVRMIIDKVYMIHSLDRMSLALEIQKRAEKIGRVIPCLVQVNVSGEETKQGLSPDEALEFVREVSELPNIHISGLMTMAPFTDDEEIVRGVFRGLRELSDKIADMKLKNVEMKELSMGMTNDFKIAVEEGATIVRIGTAIFGARNFNK